MHGHAYVKKLLHAMVMNLMMRQFDYTPTMTRTLQDDKKYEKPKNIRLDSRFEKGREKSRKINATSNLKLLINATSVSGRFVKVIIKRFCEGSYEIKGLYFVGSIGDFI